MTLFFSIIQHQFTLKCHLYGHSTPGESERDSFFHISLFCSNRYRTQLSQQVNIVTFFQYFCIRMVQKNLECPILAILKFFQYFCTKIIQKNQNTQIGHSEFFLAKLGILNFLKLFWCKTNGRNLEWPKLGIPCFVKLF